MPKRWSTFSRAAAMILVAATACFATLAAPARAQEDAPSPPPSAKPTDLPIPKPRTVSTHHVARVDGKLVRYTATAGTILLRDAKDRATASVFYVAYVADGLGPRSRRPITFSYNGGPGSASNWVDFAFGPRMIRTVNGAQTPAPPYDIIDNPDSLLDKTDLVFVDAVGTGFSKLVGKGTAKDYYGVDEDGKAFAQFIRRYITTNDRWNSPKYLVGESYGTTRSAVLAGLLENSGIALSGITLVSSVLDFEDIFGGQGDDKVFVNFLPTESAIAAYHHKLPVAPANLEAWLREVRAFAAGPYAAALLQGDTLGDAERRQIADGLHRYTGLPVDYILRSDLRVPPQRFQKVLLGGSEETIGRYDGRFRGFDIDPVGADADSDPSDDGFSNAFEAAFNRYVRAELHYKTDDEYVGLSIDVNQAWNWDRGGSSNPTSTEVLDDLAQAMTTDRYLRVLSVNGIYDMATPFFGTEYMLHHLGIAPALQRNITIRYYPSGHAIYVNPVAHRALRADMDAFYSETSRH